MARNVVERYLHDPMFHNLVDMLEALLHEAQTTPLEIREACMLAQIHYEQTQRKSLQISEDELHQMGIVLPRRW